MGAVGATKIIMRVVVDVLLLMFFTTYLTGFPAHLKRGREKSVCVKINDRKHIAVDLLSFCCKIEINDHKHLEDCHYALVNIILVCFLFDHENYIYIFA